MKGKSKQNKGKLICVIIVVCVCVISTFATREIIKYHRENCINMKTIVGFETTDRGLYLYTNDGNGYYWES